MNQHSLPLTWIRSVELALEALGGEAHLREIYPKVEEIRAKAGVGLNSTWHCTARRSLQDSRKTESGSGPGVWRLVK